MVPPATLQQHLPQLMINSLSSDDPPMRHRSVTARDVEQKLCMRGSNGLKATSQLRPPVIDWYKESMVPRTGINFGQAKPRQPWFMWCIFKTWSLPNKQNKQATEQVRKVVLQFWHFYHDVHVCGRCINDEPDTVNHWFKTQGTREQNVQYSDIRKYW